MTANKKSSKRSRSGSLSGVGGGAVGGTCGAGGVMNTSSIVSDSSVSTDVEEDLDLILEVTESGVVYRASGVEDLTDMVIQKYDAKYAE